MKLLSRIFVFSCLLLFSENPLKANGLKIALRLARSVCNQMAKYEDDCELTPPEKKPDPSLPEICGSAKWTKCDGSSCKPFQIIASSDCGGDGGAGGRHERVEVTDNSYPSVAGLVHLLYGPENLKFFNGHGFFIDPSTLLTTGFTAEKVFPGCQIVAGETSRYIFQEDNTIANKTFHPNYVFGGSGTLENNFALLHLEKPVTFNDKIKNISLKAAGGKCNGKIKFASWTKMRIGGMKSHVWNYHDKMHEIKSLKLATSAELGNSKCPEGAICASPLLCGLFDQGGPLICSEGSNEYAYAIASYYSIDVQMKNGGPICSGFTTFVTLDKAIDWIEKARNQG